MKFYLFLTIFCQYCALVLPICVLDSKKGWFLDCGIRDSYLLRIKDIGGIQANFDFGIGFGDESGFPNSISRVNSKEYPDPKTAAISPYYYDKGPVTYYGPPYQRSDTPKLKKEKEKSKKSFFPFNFELPLPWKKSKEEKKKKVSAEVRETYIPSHQHRTYSQRRKSYSNRRNDIPSQRVPGRLRDSQFSSTSYDRDYVHAPPVSHAGSSVYRGEVPLIQEETFDRRFGQSFMDGVKKRFRRPIFGSSKPKQPVYSHANEQPLQSYSAAYPEQAVYYPSSGMFPPQTNYRGRYVRKKRRRPQFTNSNSHFRVYDDTPTSTKRPTPTVGPKMAEILNVPSYTKATSENVPSFAAKTFIVREAPRDFFPPRYEYFGHNPYRKRANIEIPRTKFYCEEQDYLPGIYADTMLGCKMFHLCVPSSVGSKIMSYLCPNGTLFDQSILQCNYWYNVDCEASAKDYDSNLALARSYRKINAAHMSMGTALDSDTLSLLGSSANQIKPSESKPSKFAHRVGRSLKSIFKANETQSQIEESNKSEEAEVIFVSNGKIKEESEIEDDAQVLFISDGKPHLEVEAETKTEVSEEEEISDISLKTALVEVQKRISKIQSQ